MEGAKGDFWPEKTSGAKDLTEVVMLSELRGQCGWNRVGNGESIM